MKRLIFSLIFLSFTCVSLTAQTYDSVINIGKNFTIKSEILDQDRSIQVYTPIGYEEDLDRFYPVFYVLDGQEYFMHGIAYQQMLHFRDKSPDFIIIGIRTDRRMRRTLFHSESENFIAFLEKELIPFVDTSFRTKKEKERLYFGWEMAGGLGLEVLANNSNLFSGFILASPTHFTENRVKALKAFYDKHPSSKTYMLVTGAPEEHWIEKDSTFMAVINQNKSSRFAILNREDHYTTPLKTIHEGLSDYFNDYKPIRLRSEAAYKAYGGLKALRAYYKHRGERYDLPTEIHKETKHFLILNTMNENNYERFKDYFNVFKEHVETNARDFWIDRYAKFFLKHENKKMVLYLYSMGLKKFPESTLLLESLGDFYVSENNNLKAKEAYKKAYVINPELVDVKKKLEQLH